MKKLSTDEMRNLNGGRECDGECECVIATTDAGWDVYEAFRWCDELFNG